MINFWNIDPNSFFSPNSKLHCFVSSNFKNICLSANADFSCGTWLRQAAESRFLLLGVNERTFIASQWFEQGLLKFQNYRINHYSSVCVACFGEISFILFPNVFFRTFQYFMYYKHDVTRNYPIDVLINAVRLQCRNHVIVLQNILAGSLFGLVYGFPLTCLLTAVGASDCYLLSAFFGRAYVMHHFGKQLGVLTARVSCCANSALIVK